MTGTGNDAALRMEIIMQVFRDAQNISAREKDLQKLAHELDALSDEYRSVAYEAAAMNAALRDFEKGDELVQWRQFTSAIGQPHLAQVHAGLGWALAQSKADSKHVLESLHPIMRFRTADGCGYCDGLFRQRASMIAKIFPAEFEPVLQGYDQGIGRMVYYQSKGIPEKISVAIKSFPETRRADLWRGAGIACVYVGGFDEKFAEHFFSASGIYRQQLCIAAAMVAKARKDSGAQTAFSETACLQFCGCDAGRAALAVAKADGETNFNRWMQIVAEQLTPEEMKQNG